MHVETYRILPREIARSNLQWRIHSPPGGGQELSALQILYTFCVLVTAPHLRGRFEGSAVTTHISPPLPAFVIMYRVLL
jgi:hypothetical protein